MGNEEKLAILCPFCNGEWTGSMKAKLEDYTCSYGTCENTGVVVDIICDNCDKLVYRKEIGGLRD
jgi:hypothetical protein